MRGPSSVNSSVCVDKLSRKEIVQFFPTSPNGTVHSTVKRLTCIFIYQISNKKKKMTRLRPYEERFRHLAGVYHYSWIRIIKNSKAVKNEENGLSYDASYSLQRVFRATGNEFGSIFHLLIKHVRKEREMTEKLTNTHKLESCKNLLLICSLIIFFLHISLLSYFNSTYLRSCVFF